MSRISLFSPSLNKADSYGVIAHNLVKYKPDWCDSLGTLGFDKSMTGYLPPSEGAIYLGWPDMFAAFPPVGAGPKVAVTMFESNRLPPTWTPVLNTMDAVIVPSRFCEQVFTECGVTAPLYCIPLGVDDVYQPVRRRVNETTTFLAFMDRGRRKGGMDAIHAFLLAFGDNPKYQLILKGRKPGKQVVLFTNPNIRLIQEDMSEQDLFELYCQCDVMIAANRGEGFGLLPREFAATGGIALATAWGGTAENIEDWGWPLAYELQPADWTGQPGLEGLELGEWAVPCINCLADKLREVVKYRESYAEVAYAHAEHIHSRYSWPDFADQVYEIWRGI